mmetsp:Transcript_14635/g.58481  ORF Transcript_14635/g.58481 Transcript_14635/m.58481 type:complete len:220 (+) Transcript_14635:218-877(+)
MRLLSRRRASAASRVESKLVRRRDAVVVRQRRMRRDRREQIVDADVVLRGGLEEGRADRRGIRSRVVRSDLPRLGRQVRLVPRHDDVDVFGPLLAQLVDPPLQLHQARRARDVVDDDGRARAAVVHRGEAVVLFLAGRVPDLRLDLSPVDGERLGHEGRPDRRFREGLEVTMHEPPREARLADARIPQQHDFDLGAPRPPELRARRRRFRGSRRHDVVQ